MLTGTVTKTKMEHANESMEKAEINSDTEEVFKNVVGAQKTLIEQQKVLIDWLTGQVTGSGTTKPVPKRLKDFLMDRPTQFWLAGLLLAIIIIASLVLTFCLYNYTGGNNTPAFGHNDNLGDDIQIIQREEWLAQPPLKVTKIVHPLRMVRIMHTAGTFCSTYQSCASKVLALQGWQVATMGMPDIAYNFLIGGDGNVYVGRGAGVENQWQKNAIDIGYIGNFLSVYDKMTNKMEEAGKRLIVRLYEQNYLTSDYIVEWLARPPLYTTPFTRTPKMVRILHSSSPNCSDYQTCANKILGLQGIHVATDHLPDIAYNFMIGGDGCVYIGRGADVANEAWPDVIDIVYIGNYLSPYDRVSKKMNEAGKRLISRLLEKGKLTEDYIVVAQNQTEKTSSPGENEWHAVTPVNVTKLTKPMRMVRIMHTGGTNCHVITNCTILISRLQGWQISVRGMPDLSYNYMIGGDGNVYVGRGPDVKNESGLDSIDIGYLGNFLAPYDKMTDKMEKAGKRLIARLRKQGYLTDDYIVVGQNQTVTTSSPGQNIYERIVKWPHYDSGIYFPTVQKN